MTAEYTSAAIAAQVLTWSIQAGLPPGLLHLATRIVRDELDHARLSHEVLMALGGAVVPVELEAEALAIRGAFPEVLVRNFCLGESLAVPYFAAMRRRATHPAVRPVLDRILEDEAVHRAFGWETLDALLEAEPPIRARLRTSLPALIADFRGYAAPVSGPPLSTEERACGLLEHAEYGELYAATFATDLRPRFVARGLLSDSP